MLATNFGRRETPAQTRDCVCARAPPAYGAKHLTNRMCDGGPPHPAPDPDKTLKVLQTFRVCSAHLLQPAPSP